MTSKLPINLKDLLRQRTVEGERIEYKAGWNPDAVIRTLCAFANTVPFDDRYHPHATVDDLSLRLMKDFLREVGSALAEAVSDLPVEAPGGDRFEEKVFAGPLARITRDALSFIERNYLKETVIKHPDRPEAERLWNFPLAAIEEAVVNAVYHRSYEIREPVEVSITGEALVVLSFPGPDRSIKMDDLRAGRAVSRRYRNRRIGEFLAET